MVLVIGGFVGCPGGRRDMGVITVNVGAQRGWNDAGGDRLAGKTIGEMAAVADVDLQSLVERGLDDRMHLALAIDEAARDDA